MLLFSFIIAIFAHRMMLQLPKIIKKTLSIRISMMVVTAMAILLMATLFVMQHYSGKAIREEALNKAMQTLRATGQQVDNILLSVEQAAGNTYLNMMPDLDKPDMMYKYCRELVRSNPYVAGCTIAFKENYYPGHRYFMAYVHHGDSAGIEYAHSRLVDSDTFGNTPYTEQVWFTDPMTTGKAKWQNPLVGLKCDLAPIITFSLPIPGKDGNRVGVLAIDVSLHLLSEIIEAGKISEHSYCTLLDRDGSYIIHHDDNKLLRQTNLMQLEKTAMEAASEMLSGHTGYAPFYMDGNKYYIFYMPFEREKLTGRTNEKLGWSLGIVYPESVIFGDYNLLPYYVLTIAIVGLLLMFLIYRYVIHRQLLPLQMLSEKAQRIAEGNYNETIPKTWHRDEIGRLQLSFQQMQQSLANYIGELEGLKTTLNQRGEKLQAAYKEAHKADRLKMAFMHNMTNQMLAPSEALTKDAKALCDKPTDPKEIIRLTDDIQQKGNAIAELVENLINRSDEEIRKEAEDV